MKKIAIALSLAALVAVGSFAWTQRAGAKSPRLRAYFAVLTPGQEPENPASSGSGVAFVTFDERTSTLTASYSVTTTGTITSAHVHGPGAPGTNAGVLGAITAQPVAVSTLVLDKAQARLLKQGLLYLNFHTDTAGNGEIRGQILPTSASYESLAE